MRTNNFFFPIANIVFVAIVFLACSTPESTHYPTNENPGHVSEQQPEDQKKAKYAYLALGDSYTVGQNVAAAESFPSQLEKLLEKNLNAKISSDMVAITGWRTDNLLEGIGNNSLDSTYDFVTLLIGVNNQYQGQPFSQYKEEFPMLLDKALELADHNSRKVVVVSIPDYGYTPFGEHMNRQQISKEIDQYNDFAETTALSKNVTYVYITDITRRGLDEPDLVANDGLHPSGSAYTIFAARIAPFIVSALKD